MSDLQKLLAVGAIVNSALYFAAVIAVGLITHRPISVYLAIAGVGTTYVTYVAQLLAVSAPSTPIETAISIVPVVLGIAAGASLFF